MKLSDQVEKKNQVIAAIEEAKKAFSGWNRPTSFCFYGGTSATYNSLATMPFFSDEKNGGALYAVAKKYHDDAKKDADICRKHADSAIDMITKNDYSGAIACLKNALSIECVHLVDSPVYLNALNYLEYFVDDITYFADQAS